MLRTIISIWRDFSSQMKKQNISAYASSTAFFLFLSVIPMLMVVCAVIPYTPVTEQNLVTALTDVTPDIADAMVESLVVDVYESSVGILPVALIAMVWSAAKSYHLLQDDPCGAECQLRWIVYRNKRYQSSHHPCRIWRRVSQKPVGKRLRADPREKGPHPRKGLHGPVHGGYFRNSRSHGGR